MQDYRLFQTNEVGQIMDGHILPCSDDDEAVSAAAEYPNCYSAVEVWLQERLIARIAPSPSAAAPLAPANSAARISH